MRREEHRAGDDERVLELLADLLPVVDVGEDRLERLEVLLVLDARRVRVAGGWAAGGCCARSARRRRRCRCRRCPAPACRRSPTARRARCSTASSSSGSTSASITRRPDFDRSWLRSRRTVSRFASTSSEPPAMKPAIEHALERRHVQLRLDRRFDRDLVEAGARAHRERSSASELPRRLVRSLISLNRS